MWGWGIKNQQNRSWWREVADKVQCLLRKWLFFCLVSLLVFKPERRGNYFFYVHSNLSLSKKILKIDPIIYQHCCDICWALASRDSMKTEEKQSPVYSWQAIKELLVDILFRGTSVFDEAKSLNWEELFTENMPLCTDSAFGWKRVMSNDLGQR